MKSAIDGWVSRCLLWGLVVLAYGCGGGGGNGGEPVQVSKRNQQPLTLNAAEVELPVFSSYQLKVSGGSGSGALLYSSSDESVLTVDSEGVVRAVDPGLAQVHVEKSSDKNYRKAQVSLRVVVTKAEQEALVFSEDSIEKLINDEPFTNALAGGSGDGTVSYSSNNPEVAVVDPGTGRVTLKSAGEAIVTAVKAGDEHYADSAASFALTVQLLAPAPLQFEYPQLEAVIGGSVPQNNLSGGSGDGAVTFASSDESVATVDAVTGLVDLVSTGSAQISASKATDGLFAQASASYELVVNEVLTNLQISINDNSTRIDWDSQDGVIETLRSSFYRCDFDSPYSCANASEKRYDHAPDSHILDPYPQVGRLAYMQFQNESNRSGNVRLEPKVMPFAALSGVSLAYFKDRYWAIGGEDFDNTYSTIWSSRDGAHWDKVTDTASFGQLSGTKLIVFQDHLYLFAGWGPFYNQTGERVGMRYHRHVWRSEDGVNWSLLNEYAPVSTGNVSVFKDQLWSVQQNWEHEKFEVWSSPDGVAWTKVLADAPFSIRNEPLVYATESRLFLTGGYYNNNTEDFTGIWSSRNGADWDQVGKYDDLQRYWNGTVLTHHQVLYLFPGWQDTGWDEHLPVFRSYDGVDWEKFETLPILSSPVSAVSTENFMAVLSHWADYLWLRHDDDSWRTPVSTSNMRWEAR